MHPAAYAVTTNGPARPGGTTTTHTDTSRSCYQGRNAGMTLAVMPAGKGSA